MPPQTNRFCESSRLGVRLDGPAAAGKLLVEPRPGDLPWAQGNVVTELGVVPISWALSNGVFSLACTIPEGATATLHVPKLASGVVPALVLDGLTVTNPATEGRYVVVPVGAGPHQVTAINALTWRGDGSANLWDNGLTANWRDGQNTAVTFPSNAIAMFNDSGSNSPAIVLAGFLAPGAVVIEAVRNFTFAGAGTLTGPMGLTKSGSGTLTINSTNTYTGSTVLNGGILTAGNAASLGNGGALVFGGGSLRAAADVTLFQECQVGGSAPAIIDSQGYNVTLGGNLRPLVGAVGGLTKAGTGTLTLYGTQSYSGSTTISGGTLRLGTGTVVPAIPGLLYQLDAANPAKLSRSGTNVTAWADSATSGLSFTQSTATKQPVYVVNGLNGKPIVRFSGGQQLLLSASITPREIMAVTTVKGGVDGNIGGFLGINNADTGLRLNSSPGTWASGANDSGTTAVNGVVTTAYTANQPHVVHRYGTTWGTWAATGFGQYFTGGTSRFYNGDIAEVLVYGTALTVQNRSDLLAYLNAKWLGTGVTNTVVANLPTGTAVALTVSGAILDLSGAIQSVGALDGVAGSVVTNNGALRAAGSNSIFAGVIAGSGSNGP